jgi:hypothetical protein
MCGLLEKSWGKEEVGLFFNVGGGINLMFQMRRMG